MSLDFELVEGRQPKPETIVVFQKPFGEVVLIDIPSTPLSIEYDSNTLALNHATVKQHRIGENTGCKLWLFPCQ